jgi:hypothetical protein
MIEKGSSCHAASRPLDDLPDLYRGGGEKVLQVRYKSEQRASMTEHAHGPQWEQLVTLSALVFWYYSAAGCEEKKIWMVLREKEDPGCVWAGQRLQELRIVACERESSTLMMKVRAEVSG